MLLGCCSEFSNMESSATGADGPTPALRWLLSAIGANRLIGLGEIHGSATQHELIRELISHPEFAADDLVIEFGNALYQDVLDVMAEWPVPSISPVARTPLAGFTMAHLNSQLLDHEGKPAQLPPWRWDQLFDYYLYLGPRATLRRSAPAASYEPEFLAELKRRREFASRLPPPPKRPSSE